MASGRHLRVEAARYVVDNAPYRVFADTSSLPKGELVEYRAVVKDASGNVNATSTYAIRETPPPPPPARPAMSVRSPSPGCRERPGHPQLRDGVCRRLAARL